MAETDVTPKEQRAHFLETHFTNLIMGVLAAAVGWLAYTVQDSTVKLATLTEKVSHLEIQTQEDSEKLYTASDAVKDFQLRDVVVANIASRVLELEKGQRKR